VAAAQLWLRRPCSEVFRSQTITHTPAGRTPLNQRSVCRRGRYIHSTQQTKETNIHVLGGIWNCDSSNQAAADLHLRRHRYRDRPI